MTTLLASAFAVAVPASASASTVHRHPELDWLGSQVAKHQSQVSTASRASVASSNLAVVQTPGLDVSSWQGNVNWSSVAANGAKFAYVKATEGTYYTNPYFSQQYTGAYYAGLVHGAYHFATPDTSTGAAQADYFVNHGGGWSKDGKTFPGMRDIEWDPYGSACYGLTRSQMAGWISSFVNRYHYRTSRWPMIYTANAWWTQCVGTAGTWSTNDPLMVACYCSSPGTLPYNWPYETIWQWADRGVFPGDQDRFNGDMTRVRAMAYG